MGEIRLGTRDDGTAGFYRDLKHTNVCVSEIEKKENKLLCDEKYNS